MKSDVNYQQGATVKGDGNRRIIPIEHRCDESKDDVSAHDIPGLLLGLCREILYPCYFTGSIEENFQYLIIDSAYNTIMPRTGSNLLRKYDEVFEEQDRLLDNYRNK